MGTWNPVVAHHRSRPSPQQRTQRTMTKLATLALVSALLAVSLAKATAQPAPPGSLLITAEGRTLAPYDMISLDVSIEVSVMNDAEREGHLFGLFGSNRAQPGERGALEDAKRGPRLPDQERHDGIDESVAHHKLDGRSIENHRLPIDLPIDPRGLARL